MSHSHNPDEAPQVPAQDTADSEAGYESERYFVVKTGRKLSVANFQPSLERYAGGPFLTWAGACTYIEVQTRHRRMRQLLYGLSGAAVVVLCVAML